MVAMVVARDAAYLKVGRTAPCASISNFIILFDYDLNTVLKV